MNKEKRLGIDYTKKLNLLLKNNRIQAGNYKLK